MHLSRWNRLCGAMMARAAVCLTTFTMPGLAQVTTATIYGRVLDPSGAVIPGARITATNDLTATSKSVVTDIRGESTLPFLTVGVYTVTVQAEGFKTLTETGLNLSSGQKVNLTYILELGATSETVTVSTEAPLLNTVNAEQDINLGSEQVKELPVLNRDITSLLNLGTGASGDGTTISLNGLPPPGFHILGRRRRCGAGLRVPLPRPLSKFQLY